MSNQAAAALMLPVAIATAAQVGLNPRAFAMAVAVASSCSYLTPLEPACMLVFGPGRYPFRDFFVVGPPLTLGIPGLTLWVLATAVAATLNNEILCKATGNPYVDRTRPSPHHLANMISLDLIDQQFAEGAKLFAGISPASA